MHSLLLQSVLLADIYLNQHISAASTLLQSVCAMLCVLIHTGC